MPRADGAAELRVEGPAEPVWLDQVHAALDRLWTVSAEVPELDRIRFETAVIEIATNIVRHAVPAGPGPVQAAVLLRSAPPRLEAELSDDGADRLPLGAARQPHLRTPAQLHRRQWRWGLRAQADADHGSAAMDVRPVQDLNCEALQATASPARNGPARRGRPESSAAEQPTCQEAEGSKPAAAPTERAAPRGAALP